MWSIEGTYENLLRRETIYLWSMLKGFFSNWSSAEAHDNTLKRKTIYIMINNDTRKIYIYSLKINFHKFSPFLTDPGFS